MFGSDDARKQLNGVLNDPATIRQIMAIVPGDQNLVDMARHIAMVTPRTQLQLAVHRRLVRPACLALSDIVEAWFEHLGQALAPTPDHYESFKRSLFARASGAMSRVSEPFLVCPNWFGDASPLHELALPSNVFWVLYGGCLRHALRGDDDPSSRETSDLASLSRAFTLLPDDRASDVYIQLASDQCSDAALADAVAVLARIGPSCFGLAMGGGCGHSRDDPEDLRAEQHRKLISFVNWQLAKYYHDASPKTALARRVRNAIDLVAAARIANASSVRMSLTMAAIEAMIGEKIESIGDDLARKAAAILVSEARCRPAFMKRFKGFYNDRSGVLHGSKSDADVAPLVTDRCHAICSHLLRGAWQWSTTQERMGMNGDDAAAFLRAVRDAEITGRSLFEIEYFEAFNVVGKV